MAFVCPDKIDSSPCPKTGKERKCVLMTKCTPGITVICPPRCDAEKKINALNNMKELIAKMEDQLKIECEPCLTSLNCVPCCIPSDCVPCSDKGPCPTSCCTPCGPPCGVPFFLPPGCIPCPSGDDATNCPPCPCVCGDNKEEECCDTPDVMVCYKISGDSNGKKKRKGKNGKSEVIRVKKSKSRELRASILYTGCDCEKRNGLQDRCERTDCQGSPPCLTKPDATCGPSEFADAKHLAKQYDHKFKTVGQPINPSGKEDDDDDGYLEEEYQCFPAVVKGMDDCCCPCPF